MKMLVKNLFPCLGVASARSRVLLALIAGLGFLLADGVKAQTFTVLHSFNGSDGDYPGGGLVLSGKTLFGTTVYGGSTNAGTIFRVNIDGTAFTNLHSFTSMDGDGAWPRAELVLSGSILYGTTQAGGIGRNGTVFAVNIDSTGFTNLHLFAGYNGGTDGAGPRAGLLLSGDTLHGMTQAGGISGRGTVFAVATNGTGFTNLYNFTGDSDGASPRAGLVLSGNTLYGMAYEGGTGNCGTVFAITTNGVGFTNLHSFTALSSLTNNDGACPRDGLIASSQTLYGTTFNGGSSGYGTAFAISTDGAGFTNLHNFTGGSEGAYPQSRLTLLGNTLYGTTAHGGGFGKGTVFAIKTDGTGFTNLHSFAGGDGGAYPYAGLILSGNTLFGTASGGGSSGNGIVFSLSFAPQLTIIPFETNLVLTWPTNVAGFDYSGYTLQSTTNLASPVWTPVVPDPVVVNDQFAVTNPISETQQFYRLIQ